MRSFDGPPIPEPVRQRFANAVGWLCRWSAQADGLPLSPTAFDCWRAYALSVEERRRPDGTFTGLLDWSGKLPGLVARFAGILHLAAGATVGRIGPTIEDSTMRAAARLGDYAGAHALAAFAMMGADPAIAGARVLLEWLRRKHRPTFTKREAHAGNRASFERASDLAAPLAELVERGWIRPVLEGSRNGRPSEVYAVWPGLWGDALE